MRALSTALRPLYPSVVQATAAEFVLADGRTVVDLSAQTLNLAHGQGHPRVITAVIEQAQRAYFASSRFATRPFLQLANRLVELAPAGLDTAVLKLTNGSDAVETAVKIAVGHTRRPLIGCLPGAWHGESIAMLGMATSHAGRGLAEAGRVVFADAASVAALTQLVRARGRELAAVVLDPAQVSHGLVPGGVDANELAGLRDACDHVGTLLVFDEIQTFGWLGEHLFVTELTGVLPDVVCLGKALGAGYPLAAVLCRAELGGVLGYNDAEFTYGGHPVSCAAALVGLAHLARSRPRLAERTVAFTALLAEVFPAGEFEVRQVALLATVTCAPDRLREHWTAQTVEACLRAGVYVRPADLGRRLVLKPPLVLPVDDLRAAMAVVAEHGRHSSDRIHRDLRDARSVTVPTPPADHVAGGLVRYRARGQTDLAGLRAMLHAVDPGLSARPRTAAEQHAVTRRLTEVGIAAPAAYPADPTADSADSVDLAMPAGRTLAAVLADPRNEAAVINAMVLRHYELVTRAHDHGVVLGDRFPHRAVVTDRTELHLVQLDIAYTGPAAAQAVTEEAMCVVATIAAIGQHHLVRADLLDRLMAAMCRRHGEANTVSVLHRVATHLALADPERGGASYRRVGNRGGGVPDTSEGMRAAILSLVPPSPADTRQPARPA